MDAEKPCFPPRGERTAQTLTLAEQRSARVGDLGSRFDPSGCNADVTGTGRPRTAYAPAPYVGGNGPAGTCRRPNSLRPGSEER